MGRPVRYESGDPAGEGDFPLEGLVLMVLVVILGVTFDFSNGFHDTSNVIATSLATRALSPVNAIILSCTMNFIGALAFTGVAQTIGGKVTDPFKLPNGIDVILAALLAAFTWNLITWYLGLPSSSSHALIGALAGAVIADSGFAAINFKGFSSILEALVMSPGLAFLTGLVIMNAIKVCCQKALPRPANRVFRTLQIFSAAFQSFSHGTNDAQKTMGVITLALVSGGYLHAVVVPFWVKLLAATAMGAGTSTGGWRIIKTVGTKIIRLEPTTGFSADLSSSVVILGATLCRLPVSSTHVISSSILGVGMARRSSMVMWGTVTRIVSGWLVTLPVAAVLAGLFYWLVLALTLAAGRLFF